MISLPDETVTSDLTISQPGCSFKRDARLRRRRDVKCIHSVRYFPLSSPARLACLQVTATDLDGPINSLLRYSIVSGDPLQQFSIHSRSGEITVRTALDREEVGVVLV